MKKKKLELYYFPQCPFCQIVLSAMRVTGLEIEVALYDINEEVHHKEALIKVTGRKTVPCLFIDGKPMFESAEIAKWMHQYAKEEQSGEELSGN